MVCRLGRQAFDFDLDRQHVRIGLGEDARRHQAALGQQLEGARQHTRLGIGFETVANGGGITLERQNGAGHGRHGTTPGKTDEQRRAGLPSKPGC